MKTKHCPQCNRNLPELHFAACHRSRDGLAHHCRSCQSGYDRRRRRYAEDADRRARKRWSFAHVGPEMVQP